MSIHTCGTDIKCAEPTCDQGVPHKHDQPTDDNDCPCCADVELLQDTLDRLRELCTQVRITLALDKQGLPWQQGMAHALDKTGPT